MSRDLRGSGNISSSDDMRQSQILFERARRSEGQAWNKLVRFCCEERQYESLRDRVRRTRETGRRVFILYGSLELRNIT